MNKELHNIVITDITDIITFSSSKGRYKKIESRPTYGLSFCTEGQITYTHKGNFYVSDPNHAIILPQNESYTLFGDKKGVFPVINFTCLDFLCDTMLVFPIENAESFIHDYEQMKALQLFENNRTKIFGILYGMIHRLLLSADPNSGILTPAMRYLENNFSDPNLSNAILAQKCEISEVYFRKLFYKQYRTTPKQFVIDIRIDKAKQLLADGVFKINAISEKCGFSNPYHFCRVFKNKTGLTPTEYSRQNRIRII